MKNKLYLAYLFALINATIVGLSFLFTKTAINASNPLDTLAFRFTVAFVTVSFLILIKVVKVEIRLRSYYKLLPLTLLYPTIFFSFQAFGLQSVPSSEAGILFATIPILTTVMAAIFLKEQTTMIQKISIITSVFGVMYIFVMKGSSLSLTNWSGILLLFISCLSIAGYTVLTRALVRTFKPFEITFFMLGVGFVFFNIASLVTHSLNQTLPTMFSPWTNVNFIFSILFLGILASFVTSLLSNYILSKISATQMSVFSNLSTIISIAAGATLLNEDIFLYHIVGSTLIIIGVIGTNLFKDSQEIKKMNYVKVKHQMNK